MNIIKIPYTNVNNRMVGVQPLMNSVTAKDIREWVKRDLNFSGLWTFFLKELKDDNYL